MKYSLLIFFFFLSHFCLAQPPSFQPISSTKSPTYNPQSQPIGLPNTGPNYPMGANANDVMLGVQKQQQNQMGLNTNQQNADRQKEYKNLLAEMHQDESLAYANMHSRPRSKATANPAQKLMFQETFLQLKAILASKTPSLSQAFYITEAAFGKAWLTLTEYNNNLNQSASFIKTWLLQNGYSLSDGYALHLGIQKFMSEKLTIKESSGLRHHQPFFYDFNDYIGTKDYRNTFLTKCLATGGGQCNSMPQVYACLAEKLGANCYISFAPNHSFIKYKETNGSLQNYEPTSNWKISDQWYQENMFISANAIRSGIYLDTLNTRQIIANCMLDLATEYMRTMPLDDGVFLKNCVTTALQYYPSGNNIFAYFIYGNFLKNQLENYKMLHQIKNSAQVSKNPEALKLQQAWQKNEDKIQQLGHQNLPQNWYEDMMKAQEFKGKRQIVSGKEKKNLFEEK